MITINLLRDWQKYDESFPPVIGEVNGQNFIASCGMIVKSTPEAEDVLRKIPRDFSTYYNEFIENYRNSMFIRMLDTDHRKRQNLISTQANCGIKTLSYSTIISIWKYQD